ncbi:MAG: hypothetical protein K5871_08925 [Lachnospiraceae bacterium]|nr:hypothetical protein [Lachnospiraceae bacterium]
MQGADEQSYEEVIEQLRAYTNKVFEAVNGMYTAGQDCVDNTDNDPAAERSNGNLRTALGKINDSLQSINEVIAALNREMEQIREKAARANGCD